MTKKKNIPNALRVKSTDAHLPHPSDTLISEMAQGIYIAVTGAASISMDSVVIINWKDLSGEVQDFWLAGARSAYAVVAIHGGGSIEEIKDAK